jgi:farnesyl-diphosphate farnesyltransferase
MIADALEFAPQSLQVANKHLTLFTREFLQYLSHLRDDSVFKFCALPQVMAIATLSHCYNNPQVFTQVCKINKGLSARVLMFTFFAYHIIYYTFSAYA